MLVIKIVSKFYKPIIVHGDEAMFAGGLHIFLTYLYHIFVTALYLFFHP